MHTVCLGVTKLLLQLWTSKEHKTKPWYIGDHINEIDDQLLLLKPPNSITRTPRSIEGNLRHWKASELRSWLLHYGLVCVKGLLPDRYYDHFLLLVCGVYNLVRDSISGSALKESVRCLKHFCLMIDSLYGARYLTINSHLLLHAAESVRQLGPLWSSSCFSFEDYNGELTRLFHGTQHVATQINASVCFIQASASHPDIFSDADAKKLFEEMSVKRPINLKFNLGVDTYSLGMSKSTKVANLSRIAKLALQEVLSIGNMFDRIVVFSRICKSGSVYHSRSYNRPAKRNSYTVLFSVPLQNYSSFGQVEYYVKVANDLDDNSTHTYAMVKPFVLHSIIKNRFVRCHIHRVEPVEDELVAIPIQNITRKCVYMLTRSNEHFVSPLPNNYECD